MDRVNIEQYQKNMNSLEKEILNLEKKKANKDTKAAENHKRAANVYISKNASQSTIKSKLNQIERYEKVARQAENESAKLEKKIADKRKKRNEALIKLQQEEQKEHKKQVKSINDMKKMYEQRISELESNRIKTLENTADLTNNLIEEAEYDVFISHAWEDKEDFVEEFVQALINRNVKVWYDKSNITWGDSMRKKIDNGLSKSRFGVVVLSPNYIDENKYWTKAELDGLFQMESTNGKTLLPIWHNLTKKQVMDYSPIIASKLALTTATMTPQEIANELYKILNNGNGEEYAKNQ